jgi:tetratricopeptide (TPR) repeat protein
MLTDEDGPYFELMTGVFTDNQPDFGYIKPHEERTFKQYFMPYKNIGYVKNATSEAMVSLEIEEGIASIKVYTTSDRKNLTIRLEKEDRLLSEEKADISPLHTYSGKVKLEEGETGDWLKVSVLDDKEEVLVTYTAKPKEDKPLPEPAMAILQPAEIKTNEELYFSGLHIEQYRHATFNAVDYYLEALKRDPSDARCNNAMGLLLYRKGQFIKADPYFRKAIDTITFRNPNPYNSEPLYNLGLCLRMQNKQQEAFKWFYKSAWDAAWQDNAYFQLAQIASMSQNWSEALELIEKSLIRNSHNYKARHLKTAILRKLGKTDESLAFAYETLKLDLFDFGTRYEVILLLKLQNKTNLAQGEFACLTGKMRNNANTFVEISLDYANAGMYSEAAAMLSIIEIAQEDPMPLYYLGYYLENTGKTVEAKQLYLNAAEKNPNYIFPNRLEDIRILKNAIAVNPSDYKASYYLGNLWYDKRQYDEAIECWERSAELFDGFATVHRNLGLAYFNKRNDAEKALQSFERAFACDQSDSRVLYELDQLYKRLGKAHAERLALLEEYLVLTNDRDDLYLERVTLYNQLGNPERAKELLESRNFHPWEGGEGKVSGQYLLCHTELAKKAIKANAFEEAIGFLKSTEIYPENLGEGKLYGAQENDIDYFMGIAYEKSGNHVLAEKYFKKASEGLDEPAPAMFYNDQPPEKIFYQGLAKLKLRDTVAAERKFKKLIEYGEKHINDAVKIDYFAVSLPDMQIFDDDLTQRNVNHCNFMIGLGYLGLNRKDISDSYFEKVLQNDANHLGAIIHMQLDI